MPIGAWVRVDLDKHPSVVGFTYVDSEAGFSAQGWKIEGAVLDQSARIIVRLPMPGVPWRVLDDGEIRLFGLESSPSWVEEFYGPQPPVAACGSLAATSNTRGTIPPDFPDDLQVIVHDGGPRVTRIPPETVWVSMRGMTEESFRGCVLNQPHNLKSIRQGSVIRFLVAEGAEFPILVTEKYLQERAEWIIHPCRKCGLSELFDAPSDLIRVVFPESPPDERVSMFMAFCPLCGGFQVIESRDKSAVEAETPAAPPEPERSKGR